MSKWYVGVDVGKDELVAAVEGRKAKSFTNTARGIKALHRWAKTTASGCPLHICMEATGVYGYRAALAWVACRQTTVSVVNPAQIAAFAKAQLRRSKTDALDAQVILAFAQSQPLPAWAPQRDALYQLYALVREWDALQDTLGRMANRDHSLAYLPQLPPEVLRAQNQVTRCLEREIARLEKCIVALCTRDAQLQAQYTLLCTIPGVKTKTAVRLLAYGKEALATYSPKQLTAQAGLAPRHHRSGSSIRGRSRLDKQGDRRLRTVLYMSALCGITHNRVIKARYDALLAAGKPKMVALTACMRKLLLIAQAMLKHQTPFNEAIMPLT